MPTLIAEFDRPQVAHEARNRLAERGIARSDIREVEVGGAAAVVVALPDDAAQLQTAERTLSELGASVARQEDARSRGAPPTKAKATPTKERPLAGKTLTVRRPG